MSSRSPYSFLVALAAALCPGPGCGSSEAQENPDASVEQDAGEDATTDAGLDAPPDADPGTPITPELAPVTAAQAEGIGAHARKLTCAFEGKSPRPTAWSMVNVGCEDRAVALQYAVAAADPLLDGAPPPMVDTELTLERVQKLAAQPSFDVAGISVAGPLVTFQTLRDENGELLGSERLSYYWPYHRGVVLNVDGELRVLDLSTGDVPLPIAQWLAGFVHPSVTCHHTSDEVYDEVWGYWNAAFSNFDPPDPPAISCAYVITPLFAARRDQPLADALPAIVRTPMEMETQLDGLMQIVSSTYGITLSESDAPGITSTYDPGTTTDVCDWAWMRFCYDL